MSIVTFHTRNPDTQKPGCALIQASSAHGIELFEDLLWDLATLSFVPHVFQPTLTFFPTSGGEGSNGYGDKDGAREGTRSFTETSEASICAQLVSDVALSIRTWFSTYLGFRETVSLGNFLFDPYCMPVC